MYVLVGILVYTDSKEAVKSDKSVWTCLYGNKEGIVLHGERKIIPGIYASAYCFFS